MAFSRNVLIIIFFSYFRSTTADTYILDLKHHGKLYFYPGTLADYSQAVQHCSQHFKSARLFEPATMVEHQDVVRRIRKPPKLIHSTLDMFFARGTQPPIGHPPRYANGSRVDWFEWSWPCAPNIKHRCFFVNNQSRFCSIGCDSKLFVVCEVSTRHVEHDPKLLDTIRFAGLFGAKKVTGVTFTLLIATSILLLAIIAIAVYFVWSVRPRSSNITTYDTSGRITYRRGSEFRF